MKNLLCFSLLLMLSIISACTEIEDKETKRPNIVLIMGDDMGYSDLGCYGGEINTPHLNQLADNGLRFTQFYNTARCCPTRASLLTGLYPQQAGIGHMVNDRGTPAYMGDLSFNAVTIAEVLKENGYSTYMSGKWHVTPYKPESPERSNWPRQRGFDKFFGMIAGAGSLYDPRGLAADNEYVAPRPGFYCTTDFTKYAIDCIHQHETENPFFLYLSYTAAHWPMHAPEAAIGKYKGTYDKGWDSIRLERYERMKEMGVIKPEWKLTERDSFVHAWTDEIEDRAWEIANMEVYAAMVEVMDAGIGAVVKALERKGLLENTLILFLQDNGACAEELNWVAEQPDSANVIPLAANEPQTKMIPYLTREGKPVKVMKAAWPGPPESYTAYGLDWANASNTPFREYKHWVHEGGISTPLIAHWPQKIKDGGAFRTEPTHLIDIMATCVDISQSNYPENYKGNPIQAMEGKSLVKTFDDQALDREAIYWEHEGNRAVRMGKWKLVSKVSKKHSFVWDKIADLPIQNWELFNMEVDRTETNDLSEQKPEIVEQMAEMWQNWAARTGTIPRPN